MSITGDRLTEIDYIVTLSCGKKFPKGILKKIN